LPLLFSLIPVNAGASEYPLTLTTAIQQTLEQNPSLKVFEFRNIALNAQQKTASLRPAYELDFEAENFAGSDDFSGSRSAELTLSLASIIEIGDKRNARRQVADNSIALLKAKRQVDALELIGEVTRRYVDVLAAQQRVTLAIDASQMAKETRTEVEKRAQAGAIADADVKRAQAAAEQANLTVSSEKQQLSYFNVALAALWGENKPSFTKALGNLFEFSEDAKFEQLYARVKQNPALQIFASQQRLKDAEVRLAKTQTHSDIRWSVGVRQFQDSDDTALVAGFSLPLFSPKRNAGSVVAAKAARDEVFINKTVMLQKLHTQLYRAFSNRQQAIFTVEKLQSSIIPSLQQALKETQKAYQLGRYSYLDYLTVRQEVLSARRNLIEAASAGQRYGAEIEQLIAEPLAASQYQPRKELLGLSQ